MSNSSGPDKGQLYGVFQRTEDWKDQLHRRLAHKSLDIADDDMQIAVDKSTKGMGAKELLAIGALVIGAGVGGHLLTKPTVPTTAPQPAPPAVAEPYEDTDTDTVNVLGFAE